MASYIELKLYATLKRHQPDNAGRYPIRPGVTIAGVMDELGIPAASVHLFFVDGVKGSASTELTGGERVGLFPPVGGG